MFLRRLLCFWIIVSFLSTLIIPIPKASAALGLPEPGTMVSLSPVYEPMLIKGLKVHPENPFKFDFIVDTGNTNLYSNRHSEPFASLEGRLREESQQEQLKTESSKLIKYFLASLTIPEKNLWVNLSPYEKDRMIASDLGQTQMGQDMLAQDYILKQLTASLIYPEKNLGKSFWDKVYSKAQELYGTTQLPVNTFNKVWIVADKADVFERGNIAYIVGAHLKVMLEEDYMSLSHHVIPATRLPARQEAGIQNTHTIASQIIKTIILPAIEQEVNQGKNFAPLRQMFYSMVLASWYKMALKDAILTQIYGNQSKVKVGINAKDPSDKDKIFQQYLKAYKKGVFNYIKEDNIPCSFDCSASGQQTIPRKYFSGGLQMGTDSAMRIFHDQLPAGDGIGSTNSLAMVSVGVNPAMKAVSRRKFLGLVGAGAMFSPLVQTQKYQLPEGPGRGFIPVTKDNIEQAKAFLKESLKDEKKAQVFLSPPARLGIIPPSEMKKITLQRALEEIQPGFQLLIIRYKYKENESISIILIPPPKAGIKQGLNGGNVNSAMMTRRQLLAAGAAAALAFPRVFRGQAAAPQESAAAQDNSRPAVLKQKALDGDRDALDEIIKRSEKELPFANVLFELSDYRLPTVLDFIRKNDFNEYFKMAEQGDLDAYDFLSRVAYTNYKIKAAIRNMDIKVWIRRAQLTPEPGQEEGWQERRKKYVEKIVYLGLLDKHPGAISAARSIDPNGLDAEIMQWITKDYGNPEAIKKMANEYKGKVITAQDKRFDAKVLEGAMNEEKFNEILRVVQEGIIDAQEEKLLREHDFTDLIDWALNRNTSILNFSQVQGWLVAEFGHEKVAELIRMANLNGLEEKLRTGNIDAFIILHYLYLFGNKYAIDLLPNADITALVAQAEKFEDYQASLNTLFDLEEDGHKGAAKALGSLNVDKMAEFFKKPDPDRAFEWNIAHVLVRLAVEYNNQAALKAVRELNFTKNGKDPRPAPADMDLYFQVAELGNPLMKEFLSKKIDVDYFFGTRERRESVIANKEDTTYISRFNDSRIYLHVLAMNYGNEIEQKMILGIKDEEFEQAVEFGTSGTAALFYAKRKLLNQPTDDIEPMVRRGEEARKQRDQERQKRQRDKAMAISNPAMSSPVTAESFSDRENVFLNDNITQVTQKAYRDTYKAMKQINVSTDRDAAWDVLTAVASRPEKGIKTLTQQQLSEATGRDMSSPDNPVLESLRQKHLININKEDVAPLVSFNLTMSEEVALAIRNGLSSYTDGLGRKVYILIDPARPANKAMTVQPLLSMLPIMDDEYFKIVIGKMDDKELYEFYAGLKTLLNDPKQNQLHQKAGEYLEQVANAMGMKMTARTFFKVLSAQERQEIFPKLSKERMVSMHSELMVDEMMYKELDEFREMLKASGFDIWLVRADFSFMITGQRLHIYLGTEAEKELSWEEISPYVHGVDGNTWDWQKPVEKAVWTVREDPVIFQFGKKVAIIDMKSLFGFYKSFDQKDNAQLSPGGIDLNRARMRMNVTKEGQGVQMQFSAKGGSAFGGDPAMIARIRREGFDGLEFEIENIIPVTNLPMLLGLRKEEGFQFN